MVVLFFVLRRKTDFVVGLVLFSLLEVFAVPLCTGGGGCIGDGDSAFGLVDLCLLEDGQAWDLSGLLFRYRHQSR